MRLYEIRDSECGLFTQVKNQVTFGKSFPSKKKEKETYLF